MADALSLWTVYDHPRDFPDFWVARRWEARATGAAPTQDVLLARSIFELREQLILLPGPGLTPVARSPEDDPTVVETWL